MNRPQLVLPTDGRNTDLASRVGAWDLLKSNPTAEQANELHRTRAFQVIGGATGRRYRIRHAFAFNIDLLSEQSQHVVPFCFRPRDNFAVGEIMLAQKNALEVFELEALKIAICLRPWECPLVHTAREGM
jgi:hypothetical protein